MKCLMCAWQKHLSNWVPLPRSSSCSLRAWNVTGASQPLDSHDGVEQAHFHNECWRVSSVCDVCVTRRAVRWYERSSSFLVPCKVEHCHRDSQCLIDGLIRCIRGFNYLIPPKRRSLAAVNCELIPQKLKEKGKWEKRERGVLGKGREGSVLCYSSHLSKRLCLSYCLSWSQHFQVNQNLPKSIHHSVPKGSVLSWIKKLKALCICFLDSFLRVPSSSSPSVLLSLGGLYCYF